MPDSRQQRRERLTADRLPPDYETRVAAVNRLSDDEEVGLMTFHEAEEIMDQAENQRELLQRE